MDFSQKVDRFDDDLVKFKDAVQLLKENNYHRKMGRLYYIWYDIIRSKPLKKDYKFPVLHDFLPF